MKICVIGTGYVGLVAGTCFAEGGNDVTCVDIDQAKIETLKQGSVPIYEPGLEELIRRNLAERRLWFTTDMVTAVRAADICFIAVGTPESTDGSADLRAVLAVAGGIGEAMNGPMVVVCKSTVPVGTADKVRDAIRAKTTHEFSVISNPEFLKEGAAVDDFMKPDRVVIGGEDAHAIEMMQALYSPFVRTENPILIMDNRSAEMTKYAANAFLATRISFINEVAKLWRARWGRRRRRPPRYGIGSSDRPSLSLPRGWLWRVVFPQGCPGDHSHGARQRSAVPAPERGRRGQRAAEASPCGQGSSVSSVMISPGGVSRSGDWPSSRARTTCGRRPRS